MRTNLSSVAVAAVCAAFFACGGSTSSDNLQSNNGNNNNGNDSGVSTMPVGDDGGTTATQDAGPPVDHGMPSSTYPAFMPDFGQIVDNGGYVMKHPVIVAITWDSDPSQASFESFADTVGGTAYWQATTSEYGVGAAVSGAVNHVHMSGTAPAQITDSDLQNMVTSNAAAAADGGAPTWPAPSQDTIYAFFLPPGTSLQMQTGQGSGTQDACSAGVGGYHDQVSVGSGITSYAVVPSCTFPGQNATAAQQTTMSMSHELIEAVTDPQPQQMNPGYIGFDNDHFAFDWFQEFQSETGDACELFRSSFYEEKESMPASFDYWVQRTWSNKSGAAGHNPCVPVEANPYFNVTPIGMEKVNLTFPAYMGQPAQNITTKGFHIAVGQSATFPVGFYSDAATSGPWTLSFSYGSPLSQTAPTYLTATADKTTGQNGEKANVTVKVNSAGKIGGELLVIKSTLNGESHEMPIVIGSM